MLAALIRKFPHIQWGRILFSARESIYKVGHPLTDPWLGVEDARLTIDPAGKFYAKLNSDGARLSVLRGRFVVTSELILTAALVPPYELQPSHGHVEPASTPAAASRGKPRR
jgi:4'-phosphopantetheinyl transferase EntD